MTLYSTHDRPFAPLDLVVARVAEYWFELPDGWENEAVKIMPRGLLVGEQPKPGGNPKLPLWPYPPRSSGDRLYRMSEMDLPEYLTKLARVNLSRDVVARWNPRWARERAQQIRSTLPEGARVVACGARARDAFGLPDFFEYRAYDPDGVRIVAIPHPSGRNQEYDDPAVVRRAGRWVRWAAGRMRVRESGIG